MKKIGIRLLFSFIVYAITALLGITLKAGSLHKHHHNPILKYVPIFSPSSLCTGLYPFQNTDYQQIYCQAVANGGGHYNPTSLCTPIIPFQNTDLWQIYCAIKADSGSGGGSGNIKGNGVPTGLAFFASPDSIADTHLSFTAVGNSLQGYNIQFINSAVEPNTLGNFIGTAAPTVLNLNYYSAILGSYGFSYSDSVQLGDIAGYGIGGQGIILLPSIQSELSYVSQSDNILWGNGKGFNLAFTVGTGLRLYNGSYLSPTTGVNILPPYSLSASETIYAPTLPIGTVDTFATEGWTNANFWSIKGNTGTNPSTNFLGTTDYKPMIFKINNNYNGYFDNANLNIVLGLLSMPYVSGGTENTVIGSYNMSANTNSLRNVSIGYMCGYGNVGSYMTIAGSFCFGHFGGNYSTEDVGYGFFAGGNCQTGNLNTFIGDSASYDCISASNSTSLGRKATTHNYTNALAIGAGASSTGNDQIIFSQSDTAFIFYGSLEPGGPGNWGTSGQVLTSQGQGVSPKWETSTGTQAVPVDAMGTNFSCTSSIKILYINLIQSGSGTVGTITMPTSPVDGQTVIFTSITPGILSTATFASPGVTTLSTQTTASGTFAEYVWFDASPEWVQIQ